MANTIKEKVSKDQNMRSHEYKVKNMIHLEQEKKPREISQGMFDDSEQVRLREINLKKCVG